MESNRFEVRCTCRREPLLARWGQDSNGAYFIEVKQYRSGKITTQIVITDGEAHVKCRECFRWTRVRIKKNIHSLPEDLLPGNLHRVVKS